MITTRSLLTAFLLAPLCALTAMAQTKPNFTGTWKLNIQKSKFAGDGPEGVTIEFNHQDNNLTEAFTHFQGGGENTIEAKYTIGGKESEAPVGDEVIKATAAMYQGNECELLLGRLNDVRSGHLDPEIFSRCEQSLRDLGTGVICRTGALSLPHIHTHQTAAFVCED